MSTRGREPTPPPGDPGGAPVDPATPGPGDLPTVPEATYGEREEIARGGLGRISRALDRGMGRVVAIKELLPGRKSAEGRFIREALVTGRLEHPAIVPVYEAGRWPSGEPFYAMKLVSGRPLGELVREGETLAERMALVPNVIAVAEAIAYAHSKHVIHRDIKPSNVIVGQFGETVVIDWGLAKDLGERAKLAAATTLDPDEAKDADEQSPGVESTRLGTVLGTPAYMAPEQAMGENVDERADVYALGALLYYVLSGATPHDRDTNTDARVIETRPGLVPGADTATDLLNSVALRDPVPLETRVGDVPDDLAAIVRKAMARDRFARYPTAMEFAEDLRKFQTGHLVSAHEYTTRELLRRWIRRHRAEVAVGAIMAAVLIVGAIVSVERIVASRRAAVTARDQAEHRAHDLVLLQARSWQAKDPTAAVAWLKQYPANAPRWDEARAVVADAVARGLARDVWRAVEGPVSLVRVAPDGRTIAAAGADGRIVLLDLQGGAPRVLGRRGGFVGALAFSPDGRTLVSSGDDKALVIWQVAGSAEPRVLGMHDDVVQGAVFSPDGRTVASSSVDRTIRVWDVHGGEPRVLRGHELETSGVAFSPDGRTLASGSEDHTVRLWDLSDGSSRVLPGETGVTDLAFAPDGRTLAVATRGGTRVIDVVTGRARELRRPSGEVYAVAWSPRGVLVAAGVDGLELVDLAVGSRRVLNGHDGNVNTATFSPDGRLLVSGGADGTVRVWNVPEETGRLLREGDQPDGTGARPRVSRDGRIVAAPGQGGTILLARTDGGVDTRLSGHTGPVKEVAFSPDGGRLASLGADRTIRVWDLAVGEGKTVATAAVQAFRLRWSPDGRRLAWTEGFEELHVVDLAQGTPPCVFRGHNDSASEFSPDGRSLAFADVSRVMLGDPETCVSHPLYAHNAFLFNIAFSRDGTRIASTSMDRTVRAARLGGAGEAEAPVMLRGHDKETYGVAFSPDGTLIASSGFDGTARLWPADGGAARWVLRGHEKAILYVAFTPDGHTLVTGGADDTVRLWDVATGDILRLEADTGMGGFATAPSGAWIVSAGPKGVRLWPAIARDTLPESSASLSLWLAGATTAVIDERDLLTSP